MATRTNFRDRVEKRQQEATERQAAREKRGDKGQLDRLDKLGYTATRERARLTKGEGK